MSILLSSVNIMWKSTMMVPHIVQNIDLYVLSKPKPFMSYCKTCQRGHRSKGKLTTNSIEGFHGLALKYRNKRTDLNTIHYWCKTNMTICHKNLGSIWKLICMCDMGSTCHRIQ